MSLREQLNSSAEDMPNGKVRYAACSNYQAWRLMESLWLSEANGLARFECYQPLYNLVVRDIEQEIVPVCRLKGLGIGPWPPRAGGRMFQRRFQIIGLAGPVCHPRRAVEVVEIIPSAMPGRLPFRINGNDFKIDVRPQR